MPVHVGAISRRSFLMGGAAAAAGLAMMPAGWGAEAGADPNLFALLSDTHVPETPEMTARGTNMTANLRQVVKEVLALPTRPSCAMINGDCAYLRGLPADYANLAECVAPFVMGGLPLHVTMGNHDDRGPLFAALAHVRPEKPILETKHVTVLESPHANWFLLDSLTEVDVVTGEIGEEQRTWLAEALASRRDKPALVMAHHTPQFTPPEDGKVWGGMRDTKEFFSLLGDYPNVKAFIYGHSHNWEQSRRGRIHLINLPPVAYVFSEEKPNGWVLARVKEGGINLELRAINPMHPRHGQRVEIAWG